MPGPGPDDDFNMDAEMARFLAEVDAGHEPVPDPWQASPAVLVSVGEADPAVLAALGGPDGLDGAIFGQGGPADVMPPGPVLGALTEQAAADAAALTDGQLLGAVSAARRLASRAAYLETVLVAEFTRRRGAQLAAALAAQAPRGHRAGEHADAELAVHLTTTIADAGEQMDTAAALTTRLPATFAALAAGAIDFGRACCIGYYTRFLTDEHAAQADAILAAAAPDLRHDQLARKAAALEIKLDPAAAAARKEHARSQGRRVEARREASGNMSYGGRELAIEEGLAIKAAVDAAAAALRRAGLHGTLNELRLITFLDRLTGCNPLDRLRSGTPETPGSPGGPGTHDDDGHGHHHDPASLADTPPASPADGPAPLPALINLVIPAGTLLGWSTAPGDAGTWGLLDPEDTRTIVHAASQHPRTRWCLTLTGPDGTATAHGCARGPHPWAPAPGTTPATTSRAGPDPPQHAELIRLLAALNITPAPIARGSCDHGHQEHHYTPSRTLRHLIQARTTRCPAPGCAAQACHNDHDHTTPWPAGPTCQCNLSPPCRRHHRAKQSPGWTLQQPQPGIMKWTLPSGRVYITTPTVYDL